MTSWLISVVLIVTAVISTATSLSASNHVYCVSSRNETHPCPPPCELCHPLSYYTSNITQYFTSNTTIKFLPGVHQLKGNSTVLIENIHELELIGDTGTSGDQDTIIQCDSNGTGGFIFVNATDIQIRNLTFLNCGQDLAFDLSILCNVSCRAAIAFDNVNTLSISGITVNHSSGWGVYAKRVFGYSSVVDSTFSHNAGTPDYIGGNFAIQYTDCSADASDTFLSLRFLEILYGYNSPVAPGLSLLLECTYINVSISNVAMVGNVAKSTIITTGGNIAIIYRNYTNLVVNFITVQDCYIANGSAYQGAGMFVSILEASPASTFPANNTQTVAQSLRVSNTQFISNHAYNFAGGVFIIVHEIPYVYGVTGELTFENCSFLYNTLALPPAAKWDGGIAVHINNHNVPDYLLHGVPQFNVSFIGCNFSGNSLITSNYCSGSGTVFVIKNPSGTYFTDCSFMNNTCSALVAVQSVFVFHGTIILRGNNATNGGGLVLCDRSYMYLTPHTNITFDSNHAWHSGGAIYTEEECLQSIPLCFFQLDEKIIFNVSLLETVHIRMVGNTAAYAGSAVYGGSVDYCYVPGVGSHLLLKPSGEQIFEQVFNITQAGSDFSFVSSDPTDVCFCEHTTMTPNCNETTFQVTAFPGKRFNLSVVVVGQKNGTVPGDVLATFSRSEASLGHLESVQIINHTYCSELGYTVYSSDHSEVIYLQVQRPQYNSGIYFHPIQRHIEVSLEKCPPGFTLYHNHKHCDCIHLLAINNITCNISTQTIHRRPPVWIGYHSDGYNKTGVIFHHHCPFDYCSPGDVDVDVTNLTIEEDMQCDVGRAGVLCGACKGGLSLALGTSKCIPCTNYWLVLLVVFIFAGIALVFLLIVCNLTVTEGTINGLIFYANIVQINSAVFFPPKHVHVLNDFLTVFIAWLNLDLGIQTCFYNGMDAYVKTWLQFAFPIYIWLITILIIVLSQRFRTVASLIGRNAVKVLATLFLLSYAKLLRAIMATFSVAFLAYPDGSTRALWLHDGTVDYYHGKRIPLLVVALLFGVLSLPYVLSLLFVQCLQRNSHMRIFSWVNKLKPIFDAYTGPYKDKYRFWTGLLLLVRCVLFVTFAVNILGAPGVNLLAIAVACMCIMPLILGVHRKWPLDILEFSFIFNLIMFSLATAYVLNNGGNQVVVASISTTIAFATFIGILVWHAYNEIGTSKMCRICNWSRTRKLRDPGPLINVSAEADEEAMYREPLLAYEDT